ncbi:hypothetical protein FHR32_003779 [Streptosporangium album]|uniref:Adhesin domain-containing protein n=1 Tax=Streptosporangium album TaxID=47479 RepID=A0A7W7RWD5_9ACTN|nr:hypothetical protein [Streptosporangium album]MBB4939474.1 hypothetical protein [Streptosporangium album]
MTAIAVALLASGLVLVGCDPVQVGGFEGPAEVGAGAERHETVSYDVTGELTALRVATGAGNIEMTESARSGVRVTESLRWKGHKPVTRHPVDGGTLTLDYTCPSGDDTWHDRMCVVDYRVEIPHGLEVRADAGAGAVTLHALSGTVEARAGAGPVEADNLSGRRVTASSGTGEVRLVFSGPPDAVEVRTGTGDGVVRLPRGAYHVVTGTVTGSERIGIVDDPAAPRSVRVTSATGDIDIAQS